MALGGGTFTSFGKVLPGIYVNFVSAASVSSSSSERGTAAAAMQLSWGPEGEMFTVTADEFFKNSTKLFGYAYSDTEIQCVRDLFLNASKAHIYRLGSSTKAKNTYGKAKYGGVCGNNIKIKIARNVDDTSLYDVTTFYNGTKRDLQSVASMEDLKDNDFVEWIRSASLAATAGLNMTGGSDAKVTGEDYQNFLTAAEGVSFNTLGAASTDSGVNSLIAEFTKRMREERGVKFQSVLYNCEADDEGVINVATPAAGNEAALVWFVTGASAGCEVNKSLLNAKYDGSFTVAKLYTQSELEDCLKRGKFVLHKVGDEFRVLADINSLVTTTFEKGDMFKENQTIRIIDKIAYDDALLFKNKYLGVVPNDEAGRLSLWNDIVKQRRGLEKMRAIENFNDEDVVVERGETKSAVVISGSICPINAMAQLYITTTVE